jgi:hypothetical protein
MTDVPPKKLSAKPVRSRQTDIAQDIEDAAILGGSAMATSEPFGPIIGAAIGAGEEGLALLKRKKGSKP